MAQRPPFTNPYDPLKSPCIRQCCLNGDDVCVGCGRTLEEIREWSASDIDKRQGILDQAKDRLKQMNNPIY